MHKRLETDLMSLAHEILQMKNREDIFALKEKSKEIYEKLSLLAFVDEYINTTPNLDETKEELIEKVEKGLELKETKTESISDSEKNEDASEKIVHQLIEDSNDIAKADKVVKENTIITAKANDIIEQPFDEIESLLLEPAEQEVTKENLINEVDSKKTTLEEELQDTIPVDEIANLFDTPAPVKSLNDRLSTNIQIGLNDRIAFVKNLFDGSQEDFNRVVSQLNTFKTEKEAHKFINTMIKPDYNWSQQENLETRFLEIVARRFV